MKVKTGVIFLTVLTVLGIMSWICVIRSKNNSVINYDDYIKKAESYESKEIYTDALDYYKKAFELNKSDKKLIMKIADMYYRLEDYTNFIEACNKSAALDRDNPEPYIKKAEYYIAAEDYKEAFRVLKEAGHIPDNEKIKKLAEDISYKYTEKYSYFAGIGDWHIQGDIDYIAADNNGKWGIFLNDGTRRIQSVYDYLGAYDGDAGVIPCMRDGKYYYIDLNGNKKLAGDKDYEYLGSFGDGYAPACLNGVCGYIDRDFNEYNFKYEYAGAFSNGIAAVKKDGKWSLIDTGFEEITSETFDDVLLDSYGFCSVYGRMAVCIDGKYTVLDSGGNRIFKEMYDGIAIPASEDGYIAVKLNNRWGYADTEGKKIIDFKFEDAKSFSLGLAPVKYEGKWGYINKDGEIVIENQYEDVVPFSSNGAAAVMTYDSWNFIMLCVNEK